MRKENRIEKSLENKVYDRINIVLIVLSVAFFVLFVIFLACSLVILTTSDRFSLFIGLSGIMSSLASAVFITVVLRIIDTKKNVRQQERAKKILMPLFLELYTVMNNIVPELLAFTESDEKGNFTFSKDIVYYKEANTESVVRSFISFEEEFQQFEKKLNGILEKCLNAPMLLQCDAETIELITTIKLNRLAHSLREVCDNTKEGVLFPSIHKEKVELATLYGRLGKLVGKKEKSLIRLSDEEKDSYMKEIDEYKAILPKHTGRVYLGSTRIR